MADPDLPHQFLTFKYRLLPTKAQHAALARIAEDQRLLYNAALEERIGCYRVTGKGRTFFDQCRALTEWRQSDIEARNTPLKLQRWTLKRLDDAYAVFFRRLTAHEAKVGFPRFRTSQRWDSFGFREFSGIRWDGKRLRWHGMPGGLRVHLHRPLPLGADIRACVFRRACQGWSVCFDLKVPISQTTQGNRSVGLDLGLTSLVTLSTGERIPNPRHTKRAARELRVRRRALARCRRGSQRRTKIRREVTRWQIKLANARGSYLHQVSARLIRDFDLIAVERLNVAGLARGKLAKGVLDAGWAALLAMLRYKAAGAGAQLIEVDPRRTSQECPQCGMIAPKTLTERRHVCPCGCVLDRDHAAALVILGRAGVGPGLQNVAQWGERAVGNLMAKP